MARPATSMLPSLANAIDDCADGVLSPNAAAEFCDICRREIERAIARGELEVIRHGRKPQIPKRLLVAWLAKKLDTERRKRFTQA